MTSTRKLLALATTIAAAAALPAASAQAAWHTDPAFATGRFSDTYSPWQLPDAAAAAPGGGTLVASADGDLFGLTPAGTVDPRYSTEHGNVPIVSGPGHAELVPWGAAMLIYGPLAGGSVAVRDAAGVEQPAGTALTAALRGAHRAWLAPLSATRVLVLEDQGAAFRLRTLDAQGADVQGARGVRWPRGVPATPDVATQPTVAGGAAFVAATAATDRGAAWIVRLVPGAGVDARFGAVRLGSAPQQLLPWAAGGGVIAVERTHVTWIDRTGRVVRRVAQRSLQSAVDGHGRVVLVRQARLFRDLLVTRLRANGRPDRAFGTVTLRPAPYRAVPVGVVVQRDGRVVVVGSWASTHGKGLPAPLPDLGWLHSVGTVAWRLAPR